jgi:hypothetical protein
MYDETDIFTELAPLLRVRPELKELCRFGRSGHLTMSRRGLAGPHFIS